MNWPENVFFDEWFHHEVYALFPLQIASYGQFHTIISFGQFESKNSLEVFRITSLHLDDGKRFGIGVVRRVAVFLGHFLSTTNFELLKVSRFSPFFEQEFSTKSSEISFVRSCFSSLGLKYQC